MKYNLKKKIGYSIIILAMLVGFTLIAAVGIDANGSGSAKAIKLGLDLAGGVSITYQADQSNPSSQDMEDTIYKLQKRVEGKSTEAQVYKSGTNRITVEIPGVTDANSVLEELGTPGSLEFLDSTGYNAWSQKQDYTPLLTGTDVKSAQAYSDTSSSTTAAYGVQLTFTDDGATKFADATKANIGKIIYIVYDGQVVSYPTVETEIDGGTASITKMESYDAANNLATYIRIGSIPLTLNEVSSNIVGAQLGYDAIQTSIFAAIVGFIILCIFMIVMYRMPGFVAVLALWIHTATVLILVSVYDLTLTLPGIAGIVLGIGMSVDANVLIYSRIKEELGLGRSVENAITSGYSKAMAPIIDGNFTSILTAIILYIFGSGTIKGFATTLLLGNIVTLVTAIFIAHTIMKLLFNFGLKDPKWYGRTVHRKPYNIIGIRKACFIVAIVAILSGFVGMGAYSAAGKGILNFSLEFAGGSTTTFTFDKEYSQSEIENNIIPVIKSAGSLTEVQQQKVQNSTQVTFKTVDLSLSQREAIQNAVTAQFPVQDGTIVESNTISSTVSSTMKKDATMAVVIAIVCILLYIWLRFRDFKFGAAAIVALVNDILIMYAFYVLSRESVGTTFIACMLTILGFSINSTVIIFDRIREQLKTAGPKTDIKELINNSITCTLVRTINTNVTVFIMLLSLFIFGVASVREFALPLMVGVVCGALSSVFITSALWFVFGGKNYFSSKEATKRKEKNTKTEKSSKASDGAVL